MSDFERDLLNFASPALLGRKQANLFSFSRVIIVSAVPVIPFVPETLLDFKIPAFLSSNL